MTTLICPACNLRGYIPNGWPSVERLLCPDCEHLRGDPEYPEGDDVTVGVIEES